MSTQRDSSSWLDDTVMPVTPEGKNEGEKECAVTDLEHIEAGLRHQPDSPPGLRRCAEQHRIELPEEISQPPQPPKAFRSLPSSKYETPRANLAESNSIEASEKSRAPSI